MQSGPYPSMSPSAPTAPPARPDPRLIRPAKMWFVVAALLAAVGIGVAIVLIVRGVVTYTERIDDFDRASLPAELEVEITETGGYSIYHEYFGADDDSFGWSPSPSVSVTDPSGNDVELDEYDTTVTYTSGDHEGEGLYTFDADETGTYIVTADGEAGDSIAVGRGIGRGLVSSILGGIAVGVLLVIAGAVLAIVVGVKRSGHRRSLMPPPQFAGWAPPPGGGPGGPYGAPGGYGAPGYGTSGGYGAPGSGAPGAYGSPGAPSASGVPGTPGGDGGPGVPGASGTPGGHGAAPAPPAPPPPPAPPADAAPAADSPPPSDAPAPRD